MSRYRNYRDLYFHLFGAMAQAAEYIEQGNAMLAYECLVNAQQESEEACLESDILPRTMKAAETGCFSVFHKRRDF